MYVSPLVIVSGGQTGVDQAALDAALELNITYEGWCPQGRIAEDGKIPERFIQLKETPLEKYEQRTEWNIRDSDATLILVDQVPLQVTDGTVLTCKEVHKQNKPHLVIDLHNKRVYSVEMSDDGVHFRPATQDLTARQYVIDWICERIKIQNQEIKTKAIKLNIAGPRASQSADIDSKSRTFLLDVLGSALKNLGETVRP